MPKRKVENSVVRRFQKSRGSGESKKQIEGLLQRFINGEGLLK